MFSPRDAPSPTASELIVGMFRKLARFRGSNDVAVAEEAVRTLCARMSAEAADRVWSSAILLDNELRHRRGEGLTLNPEGSTQVSPHEELILALLCAAQTRNGWEALEAAKQLGATGGALLLDAAIRLGDDLRSAAVFLPQAASGEPLGFDPRPSTGWLYRPPSI